MGLMIADCGGTLVALALTSAARKANLTGPGQLHQSSSTSGMQEFDKRLKALEKN